MIKPTVGRHIDLYRGEKGPFAAIITGINDGTVNLCVWDHNAHYSRCLNVPIVEEPKSQEGPHACWMDYQKGQAAQTERLEQEVESILQGPGARRLLGRVTTLPDEGWVAQRGASRE